MLNKYYYLAKVFHNESWVSINLQEGRKETGGVDEMMDGVESREMEDILMHQRG